MISIMYMYIRTYKSAVSDDPVYPNVDVTPNQDGGTFKQVLRQGVGSAMPQPGDTVYTLYHGTLLDGTLFDASRPRGHMFIYKTGTSECCCSTMELRMHAGYMYM